MERLSWKLFFLLLWNAYSERQNYFFTVMKQLFQKLFFTIMERLFWKLFFYYYGTPIS